MQSWFRFSATIDGTELAAFREALVDLAGGFTEITTELGTRYIVGLSGRGAKQRVLNLLAQWAAPTREGNIKLEDQATSTDRGEIYFLLPLQRNPDRASEPRSTGGPRPQVPLAVRKAIREKRLPAKQLGRTYLLERNAVDAYAVRTGRELRVVPGREREEPVKTVAKAVKGRRPGDSNLNRPSQSMRGVPRCGERGAGAATRLGPQRRAGVVRAGRGRRVARERLARSRQG